MVAEKMAAIKLQVVHQMLLILALELKAISIRCGAIFKSSILTINLSMWIELGFCGGTMKRGEITRFLGDLLVTDRLCKRGKYYASEVSIDYGTSDVKRVDFMQFEPSGVTAISAIEKGIFTCYEIKSCKEDVFSGNGLNFLGEKNYIVTTMDCICLITGDKVELNTKPDSCPLRKLPERETEMTDADDLGRDYVRGTMDGWNACLDEIESIN